MIDWKTKAALEKSEGYLKCALRDIELAVWSQFRYAQAENTEESRNAYLALRKGSAALKRLLVTIEGMTDDG